MSKRSSLLGSHRLSRDGFKQIQELEATPSRMANPNDATIDIPLAAVQAHPSTRQRADTIQSLNGGIFTPGSPDEKTNMFKRPQTAGRRRKFGSKDITNHSVHDDDGTLTRMGVFYTQILNFSIFTRYFLYVLPVSVIISLPIVIGATAAQNAAAGGVRIVWIFTWVQVVWLSLWVSKLVAKALPYIFQFLCGIVSSGTRKYKLILETLEIPLSLAGWALASLATFKPLMTSNPDQRRSNGGNPTTPAEWENIVGNILGAFMVAALIFLGEKLLIQIISIGYHHQQAEVRIRESKHNIYLLGLMYDASRTLFPEYCPEFTEEDYLISDSLTLPTSKKGTNHIRSGSQTPQNMLHNVGRGFNKVTAAFGGVAQEVTGKAVFNPNAAHSVVVEALEKKVSSEALAKRIWMSFAVDGKDSLTEEDIVEVLGSERESEARECFACLDRDGNKDVSLDEMILTVCEIGRERKAIANSLRDVDSAISALDQLLCVMVFVIVVFVFVGFLNASFTTTLATAGTALLSLSFVFSVTAQEVLGSCIFLFVKHPFDVGDRVDINSQQLVVERISLLYTVFKQVTSHKTTQVPNIVLNTVWIDNISRSKAMREQLQMYISFDTTLEDIQLLRNEMQNFVLDKENSRDFQPEIDVEVTGIASMDKLELKVEIRHKSNWSNEAVRAARRSKFMCALVLALRKVPIYCPGGGAAPLGSADQPSYSVAVSDAEAANRRDAFAKVKEAKRIVPTTHPKPPGTVSGILKTDISAGAILRYRNGSVSSPRQPIAPLQETAAMTSLNARHPAFDPAHDWEIDNTRTLSPTDQRSSDIEEVRDVLRRQSTRGKRRAQNNSISTISSKPGAPGPNIPTISEPDPKMYHDYQGSQSQVSLGPRLPVQTSSEGFGAFFDPFHQHPPQTSPKVPTQLQSVDENVPLPKPKPSWESLHGEGSQNPRPGAERNNSFALEREGTVYRQQQ